MPITKPLSELQHNMRAIADECHKTREPVYLTKNGCASLVIMDADAFDETYLFDEEDTPELSQEQALRLKKILDESFEDMKAGQGIPLDEAITQINEYRRAHGLEELRPPLGHEAPLGRAASLFAVRTPCASRAAWQ